MVQFYNFGLNLFQNHFCFPTSFNFLKLSLFQPLTQKRWKYCNGSIISEDNKKIIPKQQHYHVQLYRCNVLRPQPNSTSWKTSIMKWFTKNYTEMDKKVVNLFVKMCKFHQEHRTIKGKVKPVKQPLKAETFLSLLKIDLMDCWNYPWECKPESHKWAVNFIGHQKFIQVLPLYNKTGKVLDAFTKCCLMYGYLQKKIHIYNMYLTMKKNFTTMKWSTTVFKIEQRLHTDRQEHQWHKAFLKVPTECGKKYKSKNEQVQNKLHKWCKQTLEIFYTTKSHLVSRHTKKHFLT